MDGSFGVKSDGGSEDAEVSESLESPVHDRDLRREREKEDATKERVDEVEDGDEGQ